MSSAKRRINSTGRRRIGRECIEINMFDCLPDEPLKATASLNLSNQDFPDDAIITLEAYHRSSGMRFDCGTIEAPSVPDVLVLEEVDRSGSVLFRLKVVDNNEYPGKLLGSAERLKPKSEDESEGRRSLLPIIYRDLQYDVWKVEIEHGDGPTLIINNRMPGFSLMLLANPIMQGLLLPAALRFVLHALVTRSETGESDDEPGWKDDWLKYCRSQLGLGVAEDPRDLQDEFAKNDWIDEAVTRFGENKSFVERIRVHVEEL